MDECVAWIYSHRFNAFSFGQDHPFKIQRLALTFQLCQELGLLDGKSVDLVECPPAREEDLLVFHRRDYVQALREFSQGEGGRANFMFGLGDVENPVFPGLFEWALLGCGGTLEAVRQVLDQRCRRAFNIAGGWHHAHAARASGFSYVNDAVIAIEEAVRKGRRVAYVDLDAHHGDGVQEAFYDTDRVLTISLHETGKDFFPHTGFPREMGRGQGYGYAANVPLAAHSDDLIFEQAFRRVVLPLLTAYRPDLLVTQLGMDVLLTDPLTRLELTTGSVEYAARCFLHTGLPWVALGGGGYDKINVARGWSLVWAIMTGCSVPDLLPPGFNRLASSLGYHSGRLRDLPHLAHPDDFCRAQDSLERHVAFLERRLFPLHGIPSRG